MASDLVLSDKDKARLKRVKELLASGENPYSEIRGTGGNRAMDHADTFTKELSEDRIKELEDKWNLANVDLSLPTIVARVRVQRPGTIGKLRVQRHAPTGINCISCEQPTDFFNSVSAKIIVAIGVRHESVGVQHPSGNYDTGSTAQAFPKFTRGRLCSKCQESRIIFDTVKEATDFVASTGMVDRIFVRLHEDVEAQNKQP